MKTKKINKMAALFFILLCLSLSTIPVSAAPKINKKTATVYVNKTVTLKINGAKRKPKWKSSNTKIATVNKNGVVRGKKAGKVKITGYFNKEKYVCTYFYVWNRSVIIIFSVFPFFCKSYCTFFFRIFKIIYQVIFSGILVNACFCINNICICYTNST